MYVRRFRAISVVVLARSCLASMLDYIVMQVRKTNREKAMIANACSIGQNRRLEIGQVGWTKIACLISCILTWTSVNSFWKKND